MWSDGAADGCWARVASDDDVVCLVPGLLLLCACFIVIFCAGVCDGDGGWRVTTKQVVPLEGRSERLQKGDDVLAVYVDTTSFYHATIAIPPRGRGAQIVSTYPAGRPHLSLCLCVPSVLPHRFEPVASGHTYPEPWNLVMRFFVLHMFSVLVLRFDGSEFRPSTLVSLIFCRGVFFLRVMPRILPAPAFSRWTSGCIAGLRAIPELPGAKTKRKLC